MTRGAVFGTLFGDGDTTQNANSAPSATLGQGGAFLLVAIVLLGVLVLTWIGRTVIERVRERFARLAEPTPPVEPGKPRFRAEPPPEPKPFAYPEPADAVFDLFSDDGDAP